MISGDDPYAPPNTVSNGLPVAPRSFGWEVAGNAVWVEKTAQFPMIDPYTGGSEETMMLQKVEVKYRPPWLLAFPVLGALAMFTLEEGGNWMDLAGLGLAGLLLGWLVSVFVGLFLPVCTLRLFFEKRTLRIRKNGTGIMNALLLTGLFGGLVLINAPHWIQWIPTFAFFCWGIGLLVGVTLVRRLRCHRKSGDRFVIRGFHPKALAAMTAEE